MENKELKWYFVTDNETADLEARQNIVLPEIKGDLIGDYYYYVTSPSEPACGTCTLVGYCRFCSQNSWRIRND